MSSGSSCIADPAGDVERINSYAVVCYIPGALGEFITRLRESLVPGCTAQSHVTILPPRRSDFRDSPQLDCPTESITMSTPPPGDTFTTMRTGRSG